MNITQTTHSAKNVHGKNPWPSGDLNPGPLARGIQWYRGHRDRDTTVNTWFGRVYPGGQVAQLVEHSPRVREVRGSSPRLAKDFFHERSWLSGLFVLCSYVPNVLVYDACFFLHFQHIIAVILGLLL